LKNGGREKKGKRVPENETKGLRTRRCYRSAEKGSEIFKKKKIPTINRIADGALSDYPFRVVAEFTREERIAEPLLYVSGTWGKKKNEK